MSATLRVSTFLAALAVAAAAEQDKRLDDVLQRKDGGILVGRILKVEGENLEILVNGEKESRKVGFRDLMPYSVYRIKLDRTDKKSAAARFELGEFCLANGLYGTAAREFDEASALDKSLEEKARKKKLEAHNEDARSRFEEAKRLHAERKYEEANVQLRALIDKYDDTPYFEEARKLIVKLADEVKKENEEKKAQLEAKVQEEKDKKVKLAEDQIKLLLTRTVEFLEEAQKQWGEGLDAEPKNLTRADRAWKTAEQLLLNGRRNVEYLLKQNDVAVIKQAKDLERQIDQLLVKTYYRLGRMWAVELNYPDALAWLNKGMKIPHDEQMDHLLNDMLLTMSQLQMRKRAAGAGY